MDNSEFYDYESRAYIQPTLSRDEQMSFISTLRDTMGRDNAQIDTQTRNLGTDVPSNLGGLTGSNSYFAQRYQTMPVENTVNTLKATAQAKALNDLMSNYEAQMKNRATQAYRSAKRRASTGDNSGSGSGDYSSEEPESYISSEDITMPLEGWPEGTSVTAYGTADGYRYYRDQNGNILETDDPSYAKGSDGYYYNIAQLKAKKGTFSAPLTGSGINISGALNALGLYSDKDYADMAAGAYGSGKYRGGGW